MHGAPCQGPGVEHGGGRLLLSCDGVLGEGAHWDRWNSSNRRHGLCQQQCHSQRDSELGADRERGPILAASCLGGSVPPAALP